MFKIKKQTRICILGMHRSNTSMVTRLLNICGAYIGEEKDLYSSKSDNPTGHWEHLEVIDINNKILKKFHGEWDIIPHFSDDWEKEKDLDDLKDRAKRFIKTMDSKSDVWVIKDPRMCLTLPFWNSLIPDMKLIITIRNPYDIAESLKKRNKMDIEIGLSLWQNYWSQMINSVIRKDKIFTLHTDFFKDWKKEIKKILRFVDCKGLSYKDKKKEISEFIQPGLNHHNTKKKDILSKNIEKINKSEIEMLKYSNQELLFISNYILNRCEEESSRQETYKEIKRLEKELIKRDRLIEELDKDSIARQEIIDTLAKDSLAKQKLIDDLTKNPIKKTKKIRSIISKK